MAPTGEIWLPADGKANPTDLTFALAKGARMRGTRVIEKTRATGILSHNGRVTGVRTDTGIVLIDAGMEPYRHSTPEKTAQFLDQDIARWTPVFRAIGLKLN